MTLTWILGQSGLLGSALAAEAAKRGHRLFLPKEPLLWQREEALFSQFEQAIAAFFERVATFSDWQIHWAAGLGTMATSAPEMARETRVLGQFLTLLESVSSSQLAGGGLSFASSAGGIYAGHDSGAATEATHPCPLSPYGEAKLTQEQRLQQFALRHPSTGVLIARLSTIYGPAQSRAKNQGLISHMARAVLFNRPIQIYVPMDTLRDYILVDDAASEILSQLDAARTPPRAITSIIAAERCTTIAELASIFRRLTRRAPRIAVGASDLARLYKRRAQYRSLHTETKRITRTPLHIGIAKVLASERLTFASGLKNIQRTSV